MDIHTARSFVTLLFLGLIIYLIVKYFKRKSPAGTNSNQGFTDLDAERKCLSCGYQGKMKTWMKNYGVPQVIAILLLCLGFIPGLIFIILSWGKYKCPNCGTVGKNTRSEYAAAVINNQQTKSCPYCAEMIMAAAVKCKHCGSDIP